MEKKVKPAEGKKVYEIGYLLVPTIAPDQAATEAGAIKKVLDSQSVIHVAEGVPHEIALAYEMLKVVGPKRSRYDRAYFGWMKFQAEPKVIKDITKALETSEKIIRFLLVETVMENTMHGHKFVKDGDKKEMKRVDAKPEQAPEDLDKSIDKLVIQ